MPPDPNVYSGDNHDRYPAPQTRREHRWSGRNELEAYAAGEIIKGMSTRETAQVHRLLDLLCDARHERTKRNSQGEKVGALFTHESIKGDFAWPDTTDIIYIAGCRMVDVILQEIRAGDHWRGVNPAGTDRETHFHSDRKLRLWFLDTNEHGWSRKADFLIRAIGNGQCVCRGKEGDWDINPDWWTYNVDTGAYEVRYVQEV